MTDAIKKEKSAVARFWDKAKNPIAQTLLVLLMLIITILILYPLLFVVSTSFKTYEEFIENTFSFSLKHPENYASAWVDGHFSTYFFNSVLVTVLAVLSKVLMSSVVAYCIGVLEFRGHKIIMMVVLSTMFFTGEITGIPQFILMRELKVLNTIWALILPGVLSPAGLGVLLGVGYVQKIPKELHEAALLDGANMFQLFWHIDFRLMIPMLTVVAIQTFQSSWSDFYWPLITITSNDSARTLPLGLITFQSQNNSSYGILSAGLVILTLPIVLLYSALSKYFIEGVSSGAVKG
jgi:raffinose/stachyose/melibiose transport system permease protein